MLFFFYVGQIDGLYRRALHILIAKGESSGQCVENFSFNTGNFVEQNEFWFKYLKEEKRERQ